MDAISQQMVLSAQSARLKPDVRLGFAISEFAQSLDDDRKREFQKMQTDSTQLCGRDAIRVTEELNRNSERRHHIWQPYGLQPVESLHQRLSFADPQTATNFRGYFERLSSLFMKLGTSWELHHEFSQIFPQSEVLQTFLCEYLIVLMQLCRKAVIFSNKSLAGQLWSSLGASFESEFKPLQQKMDEWGLLIQHKTQQLATTHVVDAEMFRRRDYKQRILHLLSPNQAQHITTWRRHRRKGECKWVYQTDSLKSWAAEDVSSAICVSGKLGSGKTVTMANIVAHMSLQHTCAFFFCTFKEQESLKARTVLGSIAFHLLDSLPADDSAWDVLSRQQDTQSRVLTSTGIVHLLTDILPENGRFVVAFDGLEDCPDDEITEVISSLLRLMARRVVLLCYSARLGSTFQRLTFQKLAAKYSLSLAEKMHDEEIKIYIAKEVARRRQTSMPGLFSDKLVELVERQLLAGAQGMYLWVSLQLDMIFPSQPKMIVTYEGILDLINNLPKDLPGAFDRALEAIIDGRYGNSIMKIVMAAQSPLTLDELSVALTVVPGDPVWYAAKVPTDSSQLIPLCGGSLLELDEEDDKVRFIHCSVERHLRQTTTNPRTQLYHFSLQEAEIELGAICVTFLNMPIFETAVTSTTKKVDGAKLTEEVIEAATQEQPILGCLARLLKKADRRQTKSKDLDIGRLLAELQADRAFKFDPHCFQNYAVSNWLSHSREFHKRHPLCEKIWQLWLRLVCSNIEVARPPFENPVVEPWPALLWALDHRRRALVYSIFEEPTTVPTDGVSLSQRVVELELKPGANKYDPSSLGLILAHLFQLADRYMMAKSCNEEARGAVAQAATSKEPWASFYFSLQHLMDLGADLAVKHRKNGKIILEMLITTLGYVSETTADGNQLCRLLMRVLACDKPQPLVLSRSAWIQDALRGILEQKNSQIFAALLSHCTKLNLDVGILSLAAAAIRSGSIEALRTLTNSWPADVAGPGFMSEVNGKPAILLALEWRNQEMLQLLAQHGGLNNPDGRRKFSALLLEIALEQMGVDWVILLLQLGADPNLGYQAMIQEPLPHKEFRYHLQITAERNQTLNFLTLIRYGADPSLPTSPTVSSILRLRDNQILMARLREIYFFGTIKLSQVLDIGSRDGLFPSTALLEVCKMLALDVVGNETLRRWGVVRAYGVPVRADELTRVLLSLAATTHPERLGVQCSEANTVLHYLTGGIPNFTPEALYVASYLLDSGPVSRMLLLRSNKYGQTPLHRAIDNGSRNSWTPPYINSTLFLLSRLQQEDSSRKWLIENGNDILSFALSKGAPVHPLIRTLLEAKVDPDATLQGATPLEIAVNMPEFLYASMAADCLLLYGADPSMKCSNGRALLDVVPAERRLWLQKLLRRPDPPEPGWRATTEAHELEDTSTKQLLI